MREIKHLSVHQWLRSAIPDSQQPTSPIGFLFLKLPALCGTTGIKKSDFFALDIDEHEARRNCEFEVPMWSSGQWLPTEAICRPAFGQRFKSSHQQGEMLRSPKSSRDQNYTAFTCRLRTRMTL